jgi:hypothetical protein
VRASTNKINTLHAIEVYFIIASVVTRKGTVPEMGLGAALESHSVLCRTLLLRVPSFPDKIYEEDIEQSSRLGETSNTHSQRVYARLNQSFDLFKMANRLISWTVVPMVMRMNTITNLEFSFFSPQRLMNEGGMERAGGRQRFERSQSRACLASGNFADF